MRSKISILLVLLFSFQSFAEDLRRKCMDEINIICPGKEPGPILKECVDKNFQKISSKCAAELQKHPPPPPVPKQCVQDFETNCGSIPGPEHFKCVQTKMGSFSRACQDVLKRLPPPPMPN